MLTIFYKLLHYNLLTILDVESLLNVLQTVTYVLAVDGVDAIVSLNAVHNNRVNACCRVAYIDCVRHVRLAVCINYDYVVLVVPAP